MRLYKISTTLPSVSINYGETHLVKYVGTQADAAQARKEFIDQGARRKDITSEEVDVPTDKAGLIAFLNGLAAS